MSDNIEQTIRVFFAFATVVEKIHIGPTVQKRLLHTFASDEPYTDQGAAHEDMMEFTINSLHESYTLEDCDNFEIKVHVKSLEIDINVNFDTNISVDVNV